MGHKIQTDVPSWHFCISYCKLKSRVPSFSKIYLAVAIIDRHFGRVEAETRKSQASFQITCI